MGSFKVNSFCGCINLRTGTIAIAVFGLLGTFLVFPLEVWMNVHYGDIWECHASTFAKEPEFSDYLSNVFEVIPSIVLSAAIVSFLLYGAIIRSRYFMLPWLISSGSIMVTIVHACVSAVVMYPVVLFAILGLALPFYIWMVVFSYYQQLMVIKSESNQ